MDNEEVIVFRLYVVGNLPNSRRAIKNLTTFCKEFLPERHRIEILDVFDAPESALADSILLTPQLIVVVSGQSRNIIGDLSDISALHHAAISGT